MGLIVIYCCCWCLTQPASQRCRHVAGHRWLPKSFTSVKSLLLPFPARLHWHNLLTHSYPPRLTFSPTLLSHIAPHLHRFIPTFLHFTKCCSFVLYKSLWVNFWERDLLLVSARCQSVVSVVGLTCKCRENYKISSVVSGRLQCEECPVGQVRWISAVGHGFVGSWGDLGYAVQWTWKKRDQVKTWVITVVLVVCRDG